MTDIVERVARALWFDHVDLQGYPNGCATWDEMLEMPSEQRVVEEVRSNARAALAAMLEAVGEPVAWRWHNPKFGEHIETEPLTENYRDYPGWTETPLYSLAALKEEL